MKKKNREELQKQLQLVQIKPEAVTRSSLEQLSLDQLCELVNIILEIEHLEKEIAEPQETSQKIRYLH